MASTYTTRIRLEKQGNGDNDSTWGTVLNQNVIDLIDTAIAGYTTISLAGGDVSLTANDGTTDESRSAVLRLTGTLTGHTGVYLPLNVSKIYVVRNATSGAYNATVLISGGSGHVVPQGGSVIVYTDGVTVSPAFDSVGLGLTLVHLLMSLSLSLQQMPDMLQQQQPRQLPGQRPLVLRKLLHQQHRFILSQ